MSQTLWSTLWQQATRTGDAPLLKLYRSSSSSSTLSSSFQQDLPTVSYARFVDLSTACALMLRRQPDLSAALSSGPLRFAVLSENSLDLLVLIAACWKAAVAPLLLSPGLSADEWRRLCDAGGCRVLVVSRAMRGTLQEQTAVVIATLEELTDQQRVCFASEERHVVECGEDQVREDSVAMLLHTSGSTGHPKLVPLTHKALVANQRACRGVLESRWKSGEGSALWLPLCHGFALASEFLHALFAGGWCCLLETGSQPPQPQHVAEAVSRSGAAVLCAVPWMLTALRQLAASRGDRDSMHELAGLRLCLVGGAALACEDARWMAAQGVLVANLLGITELAGSIMFSSLHSSPSSSASSSLFSLPSSWKPASCLSLQLVPGLGGQMLPYSADGSFQLVFPRRASLTLFAGYLDCDSDLDVFHTRDLFLPSADAGWIHVGRTDFSFKSATGLESNPAVLEHAMQQCPGVARALLYGEAQQHNALLLELLPGVSRDPSRLQVLREHLQAANRAVAPHSRVPMHALALLPEGISLPTTPKGSIDRPRAILAFHKLLNGLYSPSSSSS
ncbi:MAG: class I adenylate-forming enzyme family protein, partial [archaeon]|nr:class I adenylate-forming enzyme family protein [archaeon]